MSLKLTKEEQYGIIALLDLFQTSPNDVARVKNIAQRQNIPQRFLEQIFAKLRAAEIVSGKRGPSGGYRLCKTADQITLNSVINALRQETVQEVSEFSEAPEFTSPLARTVNSAWNDLSDSFIKSLDNVTLEQLL